MFVSNRNKKHVLGPIVRGLLKGEPSHPVLLKNNLHWHEDIWEFPQVKPKEPLSASGVRTGERTAE